VFKSIYCSCMNTVHSGISSLSKILDFRYLYTIHEYHLVCINRCLFWCTSHVDIIVHQNRQYCNMQCAQSLRKNIVHFDVQFSIDK
jgi:hypothetical protein